MEILENVGILVRNVKARDVFKVHGCIVDSEHGVVRIPGSIVEEHRRLFVPTFTFTGRDPDLDRTIPDDRPVIVTGSSAPNVIDPETGQERRATSSDIANIAFLINELNGFDVFSISTLADDAPKDQFSISRFYPALKHCLKPVRSNTPNMKDLMDVLELAVYGTIVPNAGVTSPMTLAGTLALGNAEFLALSVMQQMIQPGTPLIYAVLSTVADMRTGAYAPGAIETGILQMAHSQMARFYNVPSGGYIGLTNAHMNDAQSGYETGMNTTAALLAGADLFNMGGLLGSLMAFDYAKAVIDNEIALMLKRLQRGIEFSGENLSLDLIGKIGPGGTYMDSMHTLEHMRSTAFFPDIATRQMRELWIEGGKRDAASRALEKARTILIQDNPAIFSAEMDKKIRKRFQGLVAGDVDASRLPREVDHRFPPQS